MIFKCALAVIGQRGQGIVGPSMSPIERDEEDFLHRHVEQLTGLVRGQDGRSRFRPASHLKNELPSLLKAEDQEFLAIAKGHAERLAAAMARTSNAKACVMALLTEGDESGASTVSLLKLDAEVEAAQMQSTDGGVRLRVFQDLLPRPGDIQKGFSWPDERENSEIVVLDKVVAGSATKYFQEAFEIDVSPTAKATEDALVSELEGLPVPVVGSILERISDGGPADSIVERIREVVPDFVPVARELGAGGAFPGRVRPAFSKTAVRRFSANGIDLRVPLTELHRVTTYREGPKYVTVIETETPLTPVD